MQDTVMLEKLARMVFLSVEKWIWHSLLVISHVNSKNQVFFGNVITNIFFQY